MREPPGPVWGRAASLCLLGLAAACAGGRRPAREIATREPDGSEWSISRPALALPPPTGTAARPRRPRGQAPQAPRPGPAGTAARPRRHRGQAPPAPRPGPAGLAAASNRSGLVVRVLPARALRSLRRPPHRRGLVCWCVVRRSVISHAIPRQHCAGLYQFAMLRHLCL